MEKYVKILPFSDDVSEFYNVIDLFLFPSGGETFGMVLIEAMISEVPILAVHYDSPPEILKDGEFGYLYDNRVLSSFISHFKNIMNDINRFEKVKIAKDYALNNYSKELFVEKMSKLL